MITSKKNHAKLSIFKSVTIFNFASFILWKPKVTLALCPILINSLQFLSSWIQRSIISHSPAQFTSVKFEFPSISAVFSHCWKTFLTFYHRKPSAEGWKRRKRVLSENVASNHSPNLEWEIDRVELRWAY